MHQDPLLTVLIIAHDRREFIKDAIESLRTQTEVDGNFEVIVIKKFSDETIDSLVSSSGYLNLITEKDSLGEKIYEALSHCNGQFISFLEDDDLFVKNKICEIVRLLQRNEDLIYIHNDHLTIDINGNLMGIKLGNNLPNNTLMNLNKCSYIEIGKLAKYDPDFNLSSITIKSDIVRNNKEMLKKINFSIDALMYFLAISNNSGSILLYKGELTKFRYYKKDGLTIVPSKGRTIESVSNFAECQYNFDKTMFEIIVGKHAKKILYMRVIEDELKLSILTERKREVIHIIYAYKLLLYALRIGEFYKVKLAIMGLLNLLNHEFSKKKYIKGNLFLSDHYPEIPPI